MKALKAGVVLILSACSGGVQDVRMTVTDQGFEPRDVRVEKGRPVRLTITRKTDQTCATEIVIDDYGINMALPLETAVTVEFTPTKDGEVSYGCGMSKMIGGKIVVK